jgi:hypothetical protein
MSESRQDQAPSAGMGSVIERLAGELTLTEEPASFIAVLEAEQGEPRDE